MTDAQIAALPFEMNSMWMHAGQRTSLMNKILLGIAACVAAPFANALHPDAQAGGSADAPGRAQQITRAGTQASTAGPADYFTGRVRVDPLFPANATSSLGAPTSPSSLAPAPPGTRTPRVSGSW